MLDPRWNFGKLKFTLKEVTGPYPPPTHMLFFYKKNPARTCLLVTSLWMRLKAVVPSSYDLKGWRVVKHKDNNCQWTWTP